MTLKDRTTGRVKHGTKPGPVAYLDPSEEEELVNLIFVCCKMGYGETKREVILMAKAAAKLKGVAIKGHIGNGRCHYFCQRCPRISLWGEDPFSHKLELR